MMDISQFSALPLQKLRLIVTRVRYGDAEHHAAAMIVRHGVASATAVLDQARSSAGDPSGHA